MKKITIFKGKDEKDIFEPEDHVVNIMTPSNFNPKKFGFGEKEAFLYDGFPMYFNRTIIRARKEDKEVVQKLFKEDVQLNEDVEMLDEISAKSLRSYIKASKEDRSTLKLGIDRALRNNKEDVYQKLAKMRNNRQKGEDLATKKLETKKKEAKLTKEDVDLESVDETFKPGDKVHLGLAQKGGTGYKGILKKIDDDGMAHVESETEGKFGKKTWKGHSSKLSKVNENQISIREMFNFLKAK